MIKNYFKAAFRNLGKQKFFSAINVFGFSFALCAAILASSYALNELSYDHFNTKANRTYRVISKLIDKGKPSAYPISMGRLAPALEAGVPEMETAIRLFIESNGRIQIDNNRFEKNRIYYTDPAFFNVFDYPLLKGTKEHILANSNSVVITQNLAQKIFGSVDVLQKPFLLNGTLCEITGVLKELPSNSHLQFDVLAPLKAFKYFADIENGGMEFMTYVLLKDGVDKKTTVNKVSTFYNTLANEHFGQYGVKCESFLQPLLKIHLYSSGMEYLPQSGNIKNVKLFLTISLLILIIAIINYVNLYIARSESRGKEIAVRKVIGAHRADLIKQFLSETFLISFIAFVLAIIMAQLFKYSFFNMMERGVPENFWQNPIWLLCLVVLVLLVAFLSGIFPALFLSGLNVIRIFRKQYFSNRKSSLFSGSLVLVQFMIAIPMIMAVLVIHKQMKYLHNQDLGFNKNGVLVISNLDETLQVKADLLKNELTKINNVKYATVAMSTPGTGTSGQMAFAEGKSVNESIQINECRVRPGFIETFGLQIIQGLPFSEQTPKGSVILNQKAAGQLFGNNVNVVGKRISVNDKLYTITGVIRDYNHYSLRSVIQPMMLSYDTIYGYPKIALKISEANISSTFASIEKTIKKFDPAYTLGYFFVDKVFDAMYKEDDRVQQMVQFGTILAVLLGALGLLALSTFSIARRIKEIGIRRVLGAGLPSIVMMLSKNFLKPVFIAMVIALPVAWWAMNKWLQDFAYRINISWSVFVIAGGLAVGITLLTVSFQAIKAAIANPVKSLRTE
jgi:putative ABC transport system permease protein